MEYPKQLKKEPRLLNRFKYIINKIGFNPMELGFEFQFFLNGRSMMFGKQISDGTIIIAMNYWRESYYTSVYFNSLSDIRFQFNSFNKYPVTNHNISRIINIIEKTKTRGVTGYWYKCDAGYLKFQFDATHHKTMMVCKH